MALFIMGSYDTIVQGQNVSGEKKFNIQSIEEVMEFFYVLFFEINFDE